MGGLHQPPPPRVRPRYENRRVRARVNVLDFFTFLNRKSTMKVTQETNETYTAMKGASSYLVYNVLLLPTSRHLARYRL